MARVLLGATQRRSRDGQKAVVGDIPLARPFQVWRAKAAATHLCHHF